jgi:HTH-type transcriptional regulator/antitoxin HipB
VDDTKRDTEHDRKATEDGMDDIDTTTGWIREVGRTEAELEWYLMGPFDGGIRGLVRRIRRILDVSQRGLAAILGVSQSVVARWETGRTSPRASVLQQMLRLAGLRTTFHDDGTGEEVEPMRDDGARDHGGRRYPAHVDLTVRGWWCPRGTESTADFLLWRRRSRERRDPAIRFHTSPFRREVQRAVNGTPVDHPALAQLAAEVEHADELRDERRERIWAASPWLRPAQRKAPMSA